MIGYCFVFLLFCSLFRLSFEVGGYILERERKSVTEMMKMDTYVVVEYLDRLEGEEIILSKYIDCKILIF